MSVRPLGRRISRSPCRDKHGRKALCSIFELVLKRRVFWSFQFYKNMFYYRSYDWKWSKYNNTSEHTSQCRNLFSQQTIQSLSWSQARTTVATDVTATSMRKFASRLKHGNERKGGVDQTDGVGKQETLIMHRHLFRHQSEHTIPNVGKIQFSKNQFPKFDFKFPNFQISKSS